MAIDQDQLLRALLTITAFLKEERIENLTLQTEVAALRNTLQQLSGDKFLPIVERERAALKQKSAALEASIVNDVDKVIPMLVAALPDARIKR